MSVSLLNVMYHEDKWQKIGRTIETYSKEKIEKKLLELFPLCSFDKLLREAAKDNTRLTVTEDEIELADDNANKSTKKKPAAYLDSENPVLFRRKGDGSWYIIKGVQDSPISMKNDDFKAALKAVGILNAPDGEELCKITFVNEQTSFEPLGLQIPITLSMDNTGKITDARIDEFRFLSALGDTFQVISVADFKSKVKETFKKCYQQNQTSPGAVPSLKISPKMIAIELGNDNKWNVPECINKETPQAIDPQNTNELDTPATQDQAHPPNPDENAVDGLPTHQGPEDPGITNTVPEGAGDAAADPSPQLCHDSYKINLISKEGSENIGVNFTPTAKGNVVESELTKKFEKPSGFSELIKTLEHAFPPAKFGQYADSLAAFALLKQVNIEFVRTEDNQGRWLLQVLSKADREENEAAKKKLDSREKKLNENQQEYETKARNLSGRLNSLTEAKRLLDIEDTDDTSLGKKIKELQDGLIQAQTKLTQLSSHSEHIDPDPEKLKTKIGIMANFVERATEASKRLSDMSSESLEKLLGDFADAYKSLRGLYQLRDFQDSSLPEFTRGFGGIGDLVSEAVSRLESGFKGINSSFVVHDAIRARLSNPEERKKAVTSPYILNAELEKFNLKIIIPSLGEQLDPTHHKVVGYESGGSRGTISALVSWGLIGLRDDKTEGTIIFKPEVKIYQ